MTLPNDTTAQIRAGALWMRRRAFCMGQAETVRQGTDLTRIACGTTVHLAAADILAAEGISARVLNHSAINPLDAPADLNAALTGAIVPVEQASVRGGPGGAVAERVAQNHPVPLEIIGFPGFLPTGSAAYRFDRYGLTAAGVAAPARKALARKSK